MTVTSFITVPQVLESLFIFFLSLTSLLFRLGNYYCFIFQFTNFFYCSSHSVVNLICGDFYFGHFCIFQLKISIWFFFITSIFLLRLFLLMLFIFSLVSSTFIIAHWIIFIMAALKSSSDNSNFSAILVFASIDTWFESILVHSMMSNFQLKSLYILDIILDLIQTFCLIGII